ncbi:DUF1127 domain-containing protein [Pseudomonas sp. PDM15]|jgi:uncharacterized protein YjiS (DUF1127 family)|uniref:DUF1127 domain-containing protein n=1 Tax=Pseudomonas sp. PDM15 TaxID=2769303 RepID=UPI001785F66D|nr:DUF1127 domain-containing protein [Pseudomonas sp. PDM15]MBD9426986.1 DUF1127 domain-containing protein [Pseudomonas sp. PDM15]
MERTLSSDLMFQQQSPASGGYLPLRVLGTLLLWQRRISSRRELARLDERLLSDAGISTYDRAVEVSKPFWR